MSATPGQPDEPTPGPPPASPPTPGPPPGSPAAPGPPPDSPPPAPAPTPAAAQDAYTPLGDRARWARRLLVAAVILDAIAVVSDLAEFSLLARLAGGESVPDAQASANDTRQGIIGALQFLLFVVTAVFFLRWFHPAYRNLRALGVPELRYGTGWAIGAWFVPILNLFRPKQIANDVWRGSDPEQGWPQPADWNGRPVPALLHWWWGAFLFSSWLSNIAGRLALRGDSLSELQAANAAFIVADLTSIPAAILAIVVIGRTTSRQEARAAALSPGSATA